MRVPASSYSSSSSFSYEWTYDVFLSFRGEDTRFGFTGHLYSALHQKGIHTFIDEEELQRGEQITPTLVKAIEESRIAITVFSKNFASSSFCLDELAKIIECIKGKGRLVLPVFYDVNPSDVRHQRGTYGEALAMHEEKFKHNKVKVRKWRMALYQAANLSGWHFKHGDGYEYEFIGRIIKEVSSKVNRAPLHVANYPVGLEYRVLQVNSLLAVGSDDGVHMVGICGIGGIGKSTVARAVYNFIADQFEGSCFLDDVRENSIKHGLVHLQEMLLFDILGEKDNKLGNVNKGISILKHRLCQKKVLLILDDVDKLEQLQATVGEPDWFGSGSRIIITSRDKHMLASHGVERTYEVNELNEKEALELLRWKAFKNDNVDPSYMDILNHVVTYASGLPLALEVIGSNLFGKGIEEWESALDQYERIPIEDIQKILKVSFVALKEYEQKIFLDIACCFKGYGVTYVEDILSAHYGVCLKYVIGVLVEKSLIKIDNDFVRLHDLIEDMGKEIVRQESPEEPGNRSRLWFYEDIVQVLEENRGSSKIQIIFLDFPKEVHSSGPKVEEVDWDGEAFKKMNNLKTLILRNARFSEGPKHLPNSLRVVEWWGYPSPSLPSNFHPKKLVKLKLPYSCLMSLEPLKKFVNLTVLNFKGSKCITQILDVSGVPNLEELWLDHCENLIKIHASIGFLDKLKILCADGCSKLRTFPPIKLPSLEHLNLSRCSSLESFPEILGKMENIRKLVLMQTPIKELPFSIRNLTRLRDLLLSECGMLQLPSSIIMFPELDNVIVSRCEGLQILKPDEGEEKGRLMVLSNTKLLDLSCCNLSDEFLPVGLQWFANVRSLDLSSNNFIILPACFKECHFLRDLNLSYCKLLREIRGIPPNLETLSARCTSLKDLDLTLLPACIKECRFLRYLNLDNCELLREIRGIPPYMTHFSAMNCTSLSSSCRSMLLNQELRKAGMMFQLPGISIPEWFDHCNKGGSISFWLRNKFLTIALGLVIRPLEQSELYLLPKLIINGNTHLIYSGAYNLCPSVTDHIYIYDKQINFNELLAENEWNHVVVSIDINSQYVDEIFPVELFVKQVGFRVIKQNSSMEDIRFIDPYKRIKLDDVLMTSK